MAKIRKLYLELTTHYNAYLKHTKDANSLASTFSSGQAQSRKCLLSSAAVGSASKIQNFGTASVCGPILAPKSLYMALATTTQSAPQIYKPAQVTFKQMKCTLDPNLQPEFQHSTKTICGIINDKPFAHGGMKAVYNVKLYHCATDEVPKSSDYVAKRYKKFSCDSLTNEENERFILCNAGRLKQGKHFISEFYEYVKENGASTVDLNIIFAKGFIFQEEGFAPSIASGFAETITEKGFIWLVEQRRSSICVKFTGTLSHSCTRIGSLTSDTVHAFAHYFCRATQGQLVFADLQGAYISAEGKNLMVLFDPMTHTPEGTSGCGDHGQQGINKLIEHHSCGPVCKALGLDLGDSGDKSEDSKSDGKGKQKDQGGNTQILRLGL
ncbi:kinase-like domain-containing protein [Rhodocollybia butyracea]|uniref:Kinase-like domain-containing protein n=1 Tax=Rhodocollybia butyracea TaxID=206335 RepID=A0A9P5PJ99_9AGAR|nr:kinase-like domain-containing protein [Rhodocollybia butyracea]